MSPVWLAFVSGMFLGCVAGVVVLSLCVAARRSDEDIERMFSEVVPGERSKNTVPPRLPRN